jgi:hypothetical protein
MLMTSTCTSGAVRLAGRRPVDPGRPAPPALRGLDPGRADVQRLMAGDLADLVFTDPPYNVDYIQLARIRCYFAAAPRRGGMHRWETAQGIFEKAYKRCFLSVARIWPRRLTKRILAP